MGPVRKIRGSSQKLWGTKRAINRVERLWGNTQAVGLVKERRGEKVNGQWALRPGRQQTTTTVCVQPQPTYHDTKYPLYYIQKSGLGRLNFRNSKSLASSGSSLGLDGGML